MSGSDREKDGKGRDEVLGQEGPGGNKVLVDPVDAPGAYRDTRRLALIVRDEFDRRGLHPKSLSADAPTAANKLPPAGQDGRLYAEAPEVTAFVPGRLRSGPDSPTLNGVDLTSGLVSPVAIARRRLLSVLGGLFLGLSAAAVGYSVLDRTLSPTSSVASSSVSDGSVPPDLAKLPDLVSAPDILGLKRVSEPVVRDKKKTSKKSSFPVGAPDSLILECSFTTTPSDVGDIHYRCLVPRRGLVSVTVLPSKGQNLPAGIGRGVYLEYTNGTITYRTSGQAVVSAGKTQGVKSKLQFVKKTK